jgi:hypothetical protein
MQALMIENDHVASSVIPANAGTHVSPGHPAIDVSFP